MPCIRHGQLQADQVETVTLDADYDRVEVMCRDGVADIWFRVDGDVPALEGDDSYVIPAAVGASIEVDVSDVAGHTVVKLLSPGVPTFSVTGSSG